MGGGVMKQADDGGGRRARRRGRRTMPMSEINVTPFVDVMLVLLIIFMVAAPLLTVGVPVQLPETAANALPSDDEEPLTVTLTAEGEIMIQQTLVASDELIPRLQGISAERDSDRIFLRADGVNEWNAVAQIMGALNAAGFNNIGLVTDIGGPTLGGATDGSDG
ncbi:ExbD/TolR family protein [Octadecabacter sp.]|nr:ExbD/TolR family protein [Octadecabacter sp.]MDC1380652.1 ExbD/TolR family protein [Octadecabacter sp.]MDC1397088.1 ExbD/TolR family protein [Octadecabacter sp.]